MKIAVLESLSLRVRLNSLIVRTLGYKSRGWSAYEGVVCILKATYSEEEELFADMHSVSTKPNSF